MSSQPRWLKPLAAAAIALPLTLSLSACMDPIEEQAAQRAAENGPATHALLAGDLGLPVSSVEAQGFSSEGFDALRQEFRTLVADNKLAGVTTLVSRHGKVVYFDTHGKADASTGADLTPDSIFRIASMTKPVAGVAMMQLWEQGKWAMDDPVAKHIPEFANLEVGTVGTATVPQRSPMTMAQLMSHSAGFGLSASYRDANLSETNLQGMIDKLANLPLASQPGTAWDYGPSVNIQGYLIEKLSGQPLDAYLADHIFTPLGMTDTGFWVPEEKASRVVAVHTYDDDGNITAETTSVVRTEKPDFLSASGGLYSTAGDYWRFAQSVLNGGTFMDATILKPETVELMYKNVLASDVAVDLYGPDMPGIGFGMDFAIVMDPEAANTPQGLNTHYWGGAYGTWFWIDPTNDLVFVGMIQNRNGSRPDGGTPATREISPRLTYEALTNPDK